jgi:pimeloyl-ACP methyl ester carboxylesterase
VATGVSTGGGVAIRFRDEGEGAPVLLLHGWPDTGALWDPLGERLRASGYRTIIPDLRGCGGSERPRDVEAYAMRALVGDVTALVEHLSLEAVHLVGHDWGSALAWATTLLAPARVRSLTAISVGHPSAFAEAGVEQIARSWYVHLFAQPGVGEALLRWRDHELIRRYMGHPDPEGVIATLGEGGQMATHLLWYQANMRPAAFLAEPLATPPVTAPVLAIWSSADPALSERQMTGSQRHCVGPFSYRRLEGVGHWVPLEAPDELAREVTSFLASV